MVKATPASSGRICAAVKQAHILMPQIAQSPEDESCTLTGIAVDEEPVALVHPGAAQRLFGPGLDPECHLLQIFPVQASRAGNMPGKVVRFGPHIQNNLIALYGCRAGDKLGQCIALFRRIGLVLWLQNCWLPVRLAGQFWLACSLGSLIGLLLGQPAVQVGPVRAGRTELAGLCARQCYAKTGSG